MPPNKLTQDTVEGKALLDILLIIITIMSISIALFVELLIIITIVSISSTQTMKEPLITIFALHLIVRHKCLIKHTQTFTNNNVLINLGKPVKCLL